MSGEERPRPKIVETLPVDNLTPKAILAELYDMADRGEIDDVIVGFTKVRDGSNAPGDGASHCWSSSMKNGSASWLLGVINARLNDYLYGSK